MNKNIAIRPTVYELDGQLIEAYERVSNATPEQLEAVGLDPNKPHYSRIAPASINEYIRMIAYNIQQGSRQEWKIADLGCDVEIDNIYVQVPTQDSFDLELYDARGNQLLDLTIGKSKTPNDLPNSILTTDLTLKIFARQFIGIAVINVRPAVLLHTQYSVETQAYFDKQGQ